MSTAVVSLADPDFMKDPVRSYGTLREQAPVVRVGLPGTPPVWLVTRFDELKDVLRDPRFVMDHGKVAGGVSIVEGLMAAYGLPRRYWKYAANLMFTDGEDLSRLRRLVTPVFSARRIKAIAPQVERIAAELVTAMKASGGGDLIADFSLPLSSTVVCELIGVDDEDRPQMRQLMHDYGTGADPTTAVALADYFADLLARRKIQPADDMMSSLLAADPKVGDRLTDTEIIAMALLVVYAGQVSTAQFIPNAVLTLWDHPDQLALLQVQPELIPRAVHELLRVASPAALTAPRYAVEDVTLAGVTIRRGDAVTCCLQAANFDPRAFDDPERFDITRDPGRAESHVAFGAGAHYCLGATLGRLESEIALDQLLLRRTDMSLAVERDMVEYLDPGLGIRLLKALPVRL